MGLINRDTDYAVRAICLIAKKGRRELVSVRELVKQLKVPRAFLRKTLQRLNRRHVLKSYIGKGGGFRMMRNPEKIFLVDIIEIFQGPLKLSECFLKKQPCFERNTCYLKKRIDIIEKHVLRELKTITITSLIKGKYNQKCEVRQ